MARIAPIFSGVVRYGGALSLILGLFLWTGNFDSLKSYHMLLGIIVVVALWLLAAAGAMRGKASAGVGIAAIVLGLAQALLGLTQESILPATGHWVIQAVHLLLGLGVIGLGEMITGRMRKASAQVATR